MTYKEVISKLVYLLDLSEDKLRLVITEKDYLKIYENLSFTKLEDLKKIINQEERLNSLFIYVQSLTNPLVTKTKEDNSTSEISIDKNTKVGPMTTRYTYLGQGLVMGKSVFVNSKGHVLSLKVKNLELEPFYEYVLSGKIIKIKMTDISYFDIQKARRLDRSIPGPALVYLGKDDYTYYFKNEKGISTYKFFPKEYTTSILSLTPLEEPYFVFSRKWKDTEVIYEIVSGSQVSKEQVSFKLPSVPSTSALLICNDITLTMTGKKQNEDYDSYIFKKKGIEEKAYFFSLSSKKEYHYNDEVIGKLVSMRKGEFIELSDLLLKKIDKSDNYKIVILDTTFCN